MIATGPMSGHCRQEYPLLHHLVYLPNFRLHSDFLFQWGFVLVQVNHLLTVINSAFNFLIYWSFCCGKRRRRRSQRQRRMLSQKTFTTHSFEMQASITNEPTLLRRSRHDTGKIPSINDVASYRGSLACTNFTSTNFSCTNFQK